MVKAGPRDKCIGRSHRHRDQHGQPRGTDGQDRDREQLGHKDGGHDERGGLHITPSNSSECSAASAAGLPASWSSSEPPSLSAGCVAPGASADTVPVCGVSWSWPPSASVVVGLGAVDGLSVAFGLGAGGIVVSV
jgi:hypothetical protein